MSKKKLPAKKSKTASRPPSKLSRLLGVPDDTLLKDVRGLVEKRGIIQVNKKIPHRDGVGLASDGTTFCDYLQEYVSFDRDKLLDDIDAIRRGIIAEGMDQTVFQPGGHILVLRRKRAT